MGSQDIKLQYLELKFPIDFLKSAIVHAERQNDSKKSWTLSQPTTEASDEWPATRQKRVTTQIAKQPIEDGDCNGESSRGKRQISLLLMTMGDMLLKFSNGKYLCSFVGMEKDTLPGEGKELSDKFHTCVGTQTEEALFMAVNNTTDSKDNLTESVSSLPDNTPAKRKRGRPKKSENATPATKKASVKVELKETDRSQETIVSTRKYGLRGVKLSAAIIQAEKGIYSTEDQETADSSQQIKIENQNGIDINFEKENEDHVDDISDNDASYTDIEDKVIKKKKRHKRNATLEIVRTRTNKKIDIGDIPKPERRKRNVGKTAKCKMCSKMFCDYTGVEEHVRKFHMEEAEINPYLEELKELKVVSCEVCNVSFPSRHHLQNHQDREHRESTAVVCTRCGVTCKNIASLRNHVKAVHILHGVKAHLCHLCPAKFKWSATLKQHVEEIHEGKKPFQCSVCTKSFYRRAQVTRHQRIHGLDESKRLYCSVCGKSFLFQCNLDRHMSHVHGPQVESFHCSYCGKGFNRKVGMVTHVRLVHFNLFPFSCPECKTKFCRSKQLKDHMSSVHKIHNFEVTDNPKERYKYNKTSDDLFYCSYCTQSFHYKAKLVEHMHTSHANAFPCVCTICNQGFLEKSFLLKHRKRAHGITDETLTIESKSPDESSSGILKVIPGSVGGSGIVMCLQTPETEAVEEPSHQDDSVDQVPVSSSEVGASLLVEVARGSNTYTYYIQTPQTTGGDGETTNVEDIASLLLAAEQSIITTEGDVEQSTVTSQEDQGHTIVMPDEESGQPLTETTESTTATTEPATQHSIVAGTQGEMEYSIVTSEGEIEQSLYTQAENGVIGYNTETVIIHSDGSAETVNISDNLDSEKVFEHIKYLPQSEMENVEIEYTSENIATSDAGTDIVTDNQHNIIVSYGNE